MLNPSLPSPDLLQVIATFSVFGAGIFIGMISFASIRIDVIRTTTVRDRLTRFYIRFVYALVSDGVMITLSLLSAASLASGLMGLIYCVTSYESLLLYAVVVELVATFIACLVFGYVLFNASFISVRQMKSVYKYLV